MSLLLCYQSFFVFFCMFIAEFMVFVWEKNLKLNGYSIKIYLLNYCLRECLLSFYYLYFLNTF